MCYRGTPCCRKFGHARISTASAFIKLSLRYVNYSDCRWLVDTDKDDEGFRVIADLHGGDMNNPVAKSEFREIKDKVLSEVSWLYIPQFRAAT